METLAGKLLIAGPGLLDPNFRHTIVLIGHHDDEGAVGVVLNRTLNVAVSHAAPALAQLVDGDEPIFVGGPVQPTSVVVVAEFEEPERAGVLAFGSIGFLPEETDDDVIRSIRRARVFAGYAGWGPAQLEGELEERSWIVEPAQPGDVFSAQPGRLWHDVLKRKGPAFDLLRLMPEDPDLN